MFNILQILAESGAGTTTTTQSKIPNWVMYVVICVVLVLMIVLTIIPQKKRQKEQQNMMNSLCVGTKLMTVGGMVGKITQVNSDNTLIINVGTDANPTLIVIDKKAVGYVLEKVAAPVEAAPAEEPAKEEAPAAEETVEALVCDSNCDECKDKDACDKAVSGEVEEDK